MYMKKFFIPCFLFISLIFISCGSSFESDVAKVAELQCKLKRLTKEAKANGDAGELRKELRELTKEMKGKYNTYSEFAKFNQEVNAKVKECN